MFPITADEILTFGKTLEGQTLQTSARHKEFTIEVRDERCSDEGRIVAGVSSFP
jgi:hypothetical protein